MPEEVLSLSFSFPTPYPVHLVGGRRGLRREEGLRGNNLFDFNIRKVYAEEVKEIDMVYWWWSTPGGVR